MLSFHSLNTYRGYMEQSCYLLEVLPRKKFEC